VADPRPAHTAAAAPGAGLASCPVPLWERYDLAMLDLDGVVYIGPHAVPDVPQHLAAAVDAGMRRAFVTNNASRPPAVVAAHLVEIGVPAEADDVVTSAQAAARLMLDQVDAGATVFVIGGAGLFAALEELGLRPTQSIDDDPVAVVSGYGADLAWRTVSDGAMLVREGLPWIVSNADLTVPTPRGPGPGNGVLVRAVAEYAGVTPVVAGKPQPPLFHETQRRVGGVRPLVVGDRLDTDIEGAVRAGYDSLLVMTGVTTVQVLADAPVGCRPSYVGATLAALGHAHPVPRRDGGAWLVEGWRAVVSAGRMEVCGDGTVDDWLRAVAAAAWTHRDATGEVADVAGLALPVG
jgi:glycerol 3-phosphatase-2